MAISINANQYLKEVFKDDKEYKEIQNCVTHCNQQIVNEQKSWKDLTYSNKYNIITIAALSAILAFALPTLYVFNKTLFLESKASKKALETMLIFHNTFSKNSAQQTCKKRESGGLEELRASQKERRNSSIVSLFMETLPKYKGRIYTNLLENLSLDNLKRAFSEFNSISLEEVRILLEDLGGAPLGTLESVFPELQAIPIQNVHGRFSAADVKRICPELTDASLKEIETKLEDNIPEKLEQLRNLKRIVLKDVKDLLTRPSLKRFDALIRMQKIWNMKKTKELVWERADESILGSLEKVAFIQMIND